MSEMGENGDTTRIACAREYSCRLAPSVHTHTVRLHARTRVPTGTTQAGAHFVGAQYPVRNERNSLLYHSHLQPLFGAKCSAAQ